MKYLLILLISTTCYCQNLDLENFEKIKNFSFEIINSLKNKNIDKLSKKSNLKNAFNYYELNKLIKSINLKTDSTFTAPYFLINKKNQYKITIFSFKMIDKRNNEKFMRGKYYFIIKLLVDFKNEIIEYSDPLIILDKLGIEKWWVSNYKNYVNRAKIIHDKFGYVPPPPPLPPQNLK